MYSEKYLDKWKEKKTGLFTKQNIENKVLTLSLSWENKYHLVFQK